MLHLVYNQRVKENKKVIHHPLTDILKIITQLMIDVKMCQNNAMKYTVIHTSKLHPHNMGGMNWWKHILTIGTLAWR